MARAKKSSDKTRRGSPEAIAKRRVARALNRLFEEGGTTTALDGRTLKRKKRLMKELKDGKAGKPLKALEVLGHVTELLQLGETLTTLRKLKPKLPPAPPVTEESLAIYRETQSQYGFDPKAWKLLGVDLAKDDGPAKPAAKAPRKKAAKKAAKKKKTSRKKA